MRLLNVLLVLGAIALLFGCIQITQSFSFNEPFQVTQGNTYFNADKNVSIKVISFSDSRCPQGVECIWAGELGVNLLVNDSNVYLGETTSKSVTVDVNSNAVNLTLVSIQLAQADILVTFTPGNQS